jgi:hypothetical protein
MSMSSTPHTILRPAPMKNAKIGVTLQNIANRKSIYFFNGYTKADAPLFFTLPGRSVQLNLSASF